MDARPTVTTTITDADRELGLKLASRGTRRSAERIAEALAEARRQGYNAACRDRMSRDSGDPSSVSREDTERATAVFGRTHGADLADIARTVARWREVDHEAGRQDGLAELERSSDLAHAAGYAEGLDANGCPSEAHGGVDCPGDACRYAR